MERVVEGELKELRISSHDLIQGDLLYINPEEIVPCDILLIEGNCIVNEGLLTGETTPIQKTFHEVGTQIKSCSVLYSGTTCLISKGTNLNCYAKGIAIATGFQTFKGELIRQILHQESEEFRFHRDSYYYLLMTFLVTVIGLIWYVFYMLFFSSIKYSYYKIFIKGMELFTTAVPPTMLLCLSLGLDYSVENLKTKGIQTLLMNRINLAARIKIMCFDKTGTLTENMLFFSGFIYKTVSEEGRYLLSDFESRMTPTLH